MNIFQRGVLRTFWWLIRRWYPGHTWSEALCVICEHNNPTCDACDKFSQWRLSKKDSAEVNRCWGPPFCMKIPREVWGWGGSDEELDHWVKEHVWDAGCPYCTPDGHCVYGECYLEPFDLHCGCKKG